MAFLKLKKKTPKVKSDITNDGVRSIVKEELALSAADQKKLNDEERKRQLIAKKIHALPRQTRLRFLRYLKAKKGGQDGKSQTP